MGKAFSCGKGKAGRVHPTTGLLRWMWDGVSGIVPGFTSAKPLLRIQKNGVTMAATPFFCPWTGEIPPSVPASQTERTSGTCFPGGAPGEKRRENPHCPKAGEESGAKETGLKQAASGHIQIRTDDVFGQRTSQVSRHCADLCRVGQIPKRADTRFTGDIGVGLIAGQ